MLASFSLPYNQSPLRSFSFSDGVDTLKRQNSTSKLNHFFWGSNIS